MKNDDKQKEEEKIDEPEDKDTVDESEDLKQQIEDVENKYKRAIADYQNLQRRVQEEKSEWIKTANGNLIIRLLPALDHLETALKGAKESGQQSSWLQGVEMTVAELRRVLEEEGLHPVQVEKFDPNIHEVVKATEGPEGTIEDVYQMGYTLNGKLIRPAKVAAGKGK